MKQTIKMCVIAAMIFYILGGIVCYILISTRKDYSDWIITEATILDTWSEIKRKHDDSRTVYLTRYEYEIDGVVYVNDEEGVNLEEHDGKIKIYVNPNSHDKSVIVNNKEVYDNLPMLIMIVITMVNIVMIVYNVIYEFIKSKKENTLESNNQ